MNRLVVVLIFSIVSISILNAQTVPISEAQAREELRKRGLEDDEVRKKLEAKGIDIDNIQPSQLPELEAALQEAVRELEAEQKAATTGAAKELATEGAEAVVKEEAGEIAKESSKEIQDAVEDGKSIDEAIAEELIDNAQENNPPAKIYGQEIFRDKRISVFSETQDMLPPDTYILGPGDQVNVSIWGLSQEEANYTVNKSGYIKPSQMPRINLKGVTYGKAKELVESRFSQYYRFRPEEFEMTITYARTITVNIYGEVFSPGGFTMPATNTAFNALVASGGPSDIGSVRNIRLIRANEIKNIDVYEFMNDPSIKNGFYLQDNDIIHVGTAQRVVSINGAVRRPFRYELTASENLKQLIEYAGRLNDNAYRTTIRVKRFEDDLERIIDVDWASLSKSGQDFPLEAGDEVDINAIPTPFKNFVEITGAVELPKKFELANGMKIKDLVEIGVLKEGAKTDLAFLIRTNEDGTIEYEKVNLSEALQSPASAANLSLRPKDRLMVLSSSTYADKTTITIGGAVRNPSEYGFDVKEGLRIEDAITLAGGLRADATNFAYITRTNINNPEEKSFIRIDLKEVMDNPASTENQVLKPFDNLVIYSTTTYTDEFFIKVAGAVRNPGEFRWDESLKLRDALTMGGGLRLEAAKSRIDISRLVIQNDEPTKTIVATVDVDEDLNLSGGEDLDLQPFDQIYVRRVPEFELQQNVVLNGEVKYPGVYPLLDDNEKLSSVIARAGGLTGEAFMDGSTLYRAEGGTGFVILDMEKALKNSTSRFNFILKAGDEIEIPKRKDLVTIKIANTRAAELYPDKLLSAGKLNVAYNSGKHARYYINEYAAGLGENARGRLITVEHPNGEIKRTKNLILFKIYPKVRKGSVVSIGRKKEKEKKAEQVGGEKEKVNWGKVVGDTLAQTTAVLSLILLIQQVNK